MVPVSCLEITLVWSYNELTAQHRGSLLYYNYEGENFYYYYKCLAHSIWIFGYWILNSNISWIQSMFITKVNDLWENVFLNCLLVVGLFLEGVICSYTDQMEIKDNKCNLI